MDKEKVFEEARDGRLALLLESLGLDQIDLFLDYVKAEHEWKINQIRSSRI